MKKIAIICLVVLLLFTQPVFATDIADDASITQGCNTLDGLMPFLGNQQLVSNGKSMLVYEINTDTLMYADNADEQVYPASLVKILTALIAIEKGNLTDAVTVQAEVLSTLAPDAAVVELVVDEVLTVEDLLYCMMVGSGNDAAVVLADYVMGDQQTFVAEMNRYAQELGCTGTNFTNVHGLHDKNQYTTARDTARILAKAIQNETFCKVFGAKYYSVPETNKSSDRHLATENYLMNNDKVVIHYDERVIGSRTGVAADRGRNIATVAEVEDMRLICIVMGAKSQYEKDGYSEKVFGGYDETQKLLDLGFSGYKTAQIIHPNQVIMQTAVVNGSSDVSIGTRNGAAAVIPDNMVSNGLSYRYVNETALTAPIEKGQKVSTLQIWCGTVCVAQTDLYAMNTVLPAGSLFANNEERGAVGIIAVILYVMAGIAGVILLGFLVLSGLRATRIAKAKRQSRRNRRNRRRSRG